MAPDPLTPDNTTIVLVDFAVGFAPIVGSHELAGHKSNVLGLAETAKLFDAALVVTNGKPDLPSGPLYPELLEALDGHPIVERPGFFNVFADDGVAAAVRETGNRNVVLAGISTEGCALQSVLGGLREGYAMHVAVDVCASVTTETHDVAVRRMVQAGAVPLTWYSLAGEFLWTHESPHEDGFRTRLMSRVPSMWAGSELYAATRRNAVA